MEDPTQEAQLLQRIVELLDRDRLGLIDDPPGRRTIYAHRNSDSLWHFWDQNEESRIPIEKEAVRGVLTDCFCYVKRSAEGESTKVRVALQCASAEYEIETSLNATSGRGLMSGLLEAGEDIERPITIGVRPADKEQVLFMDVYTDESGLQINGNHIGAGDEDAALDAVRTVRQRLGLSADPFDNRIANRDDSRNTGGQSGAPPRGQNLPEDQSARGQDEFSGTHHRENEKYNPNRPPTPEAGTEHGHISQDDALTLWNAAKANGYDRELFSTMLREEFGIEDGPQFLNVDDFERAWRFACDKAHWEDQRETFEPDDELPF